MPKFYSKIKGRDKLAYRTPNWFRRTIKYEKNILKAEFAPMKKGSPKSR